MADQEAMATAKLPGGGGGGSGGGDKKENLSELIARWTDIRERIKALYDSGAPSEEALAPLQERRGNIVDRIQRLVRNNPNLRDDAIDMGFRSDLLQGYNSGGGNNEPPRDPDDLGGQDPPGNQGGGGGNGSGGGGTGGGSGGGNNGGGGNNDTGGPNHDLLPDGAKVVKLGNGKYRVIWSEKVPGTDKNINFSYNITEKELKSGKYGVTMKDVKGNISPQWVKRHGKFYNFGHVSEIKRGQGGNEHPFKKFLKLLTEQHPNASWLNSREVLRIMLQAKVEGRGSEWTDNMLRQTKWWQKRTEEERAWELTAGAEQDKRIGEQSANLKTMLDASFGPNVKWAKHVSDNQLQKWSTAIASGRISANVIANRINNLAQRVEGTNAWTNFYEEAQGNANSLANFDNAFAFVRDAAVEWLGYHGRPDKTWMENQAKLLSQGKLSQEELKADLRAKKQALYRYLAPDETWMSRASSYKNLFEELTGNPIGYDDPILRDFSARAKDGTPDPDKAMSLDDWDRWIRRHDKRWRTSDRFTDERSGLRNLIQQQFTGLSGGF